MEGIDRDHLHLYNNYSGGLRPLGFVLKQYSLDPTYSLLDSPSFGAYSDSMLGR